jgi:23S rRNA maturation-related 3'-5' exoribonuclease YhaM
LCIYYCTLQEYVYSTYILHEIVHTLHLVIIHNSYYTVKVLLFVDATFRTGHIKVSIPGENYL